MLRLVWICCLTTCSYWVCAAHYYGATNGKNAGTFLAYTYLAKYKEYAISEMERTGIPASITLAQGMYESGFGRSELAVKGNNHFGIKCKSNWIGAKMYYTDDAPDECFRKYATARDSYRDHSNFLTDRSHYDFLFSLPTTDYKGWAAGLKKAGYATDPNYSEKLVAIIQRFKLYQYDRQVSLPYGNPPDNYDAEPVEPLPSDDYDAFIYADDGVFAGAAWGRPRLTNTTLTQLERIDAILQQSIAERPMTVAPRSLSGAPIIDVDVERIKPTFSDKQTLLSSSRATVPLPEPLPSLSTPPNNAVTAPANSKGAALLSDHILANGASTATELTADNWLPEIVWINKLKAVQYEQTVSLEQIASQYQLALADLLLYNDLIDAQTPVPPHVPVFLSPKKNRYLGNEKIHQVQTSDDMWLIAQQYGLVLADLYDRNAMRDHTQPLAGEQILLKGKAPYPPKIHYNRTPKNSETAQQNGSSTTAGGSPTVFRRTVLVAPSANTDQAASLSQATLYYTVQAGDTIDALATRYQTTEVRIQQVNNLSANAKLRAGDILLILP